MSLANKFPRFLSFSKCLIFSSQVQFLFFFQLLVFPSAGGVPLSEFHLPPCCFMRGHPGSLIASAPSEQNGTYELAAGSRSAVSGEILELEEATNPVYKLVVPLKFPSNKAATASLSPPPTSISSSSIPDETIEASPLEPVQLIKAGIFDSDPSTTSPSPLKTGINSSGAAIPEQSGVTKAGSDVVNVFLINELEKLKRDRERQLLQQGTTTASTPLITEASLQKEVSVFAKLSQLGLSMAERLQQLSTHFQNVATPITSTSSFPDAVQNSHGPYQMFRKFVKRQATQEEPMKMPAVWIKNLRRALYQSLTRDSGKEESPNSQHKKPDGIEMDSKLLWKHLRTAKLKYIDLATQVTSDLPEEIYLPAGQGPIVSGIATIAGLSRDLEIRIPSELYIPNKSAVDNQGAGSGEGTADFCKCNLVDTGDMILAYWSISRIISEDGHPALQYLVYPHPQPYHTVSLPTPPELLPFYNGGEFRPSPIDYHRNEISNSKNDFHHHHKVPIVSERNRNPKYHEDFLSGGSSPPPPPHFATHPGDPPQGVLVDHNGKYTDDFINLYRGAIDHHFQNVDAMKNFMHFEEEHFINEQFPQVLPSPPPPPPSLHHNLNLHNQPFDFVEVPPTSIPGIATPVGPGPTHLLHDHPKSIQEIISPFILPPVLPPQQQVGQHVPQQPPFYNNGQVPLYLYNDPRFGLVGQKIPPGPTYNRHPQQQQQQHQHPHNNKIPHKEYNNRPKLQHDKRYPPPPNRDHPKKQAYVKDYYNNYHKPKNFAQRIGPTGGSLNDIDNPDGYILDFKK